LDELRKIKFPSKTPANICWNFITFFYKSPIGLHVNIECISFKPIWPQ
jgi:hypothetical protein